MGAQTVLDFINNWRTAQGIANDGNALSQAQLREFALGVQTQLQTLSVRPSDPSGIRTWAADANPLAYSGSIEPNGIPAYQAANAVSATSGGKWYYISDTEAGRLNNDPRFEEALRDAVGGSDKVAVADRLKSGVFSSDPELGRFSRYGVSDIVSFDDFISREMISTGRGDMRIMAPGGREGSVIATTELPAMLAEPGITKINGIPKEVYAEVYRSAYATGGQAAGEAALLDAVKYSSAELMGNTRVGLVNGEVRVSYGNFFAGTDTSVPAAPPELATVESYSDKFKSIGTNAQAEIPAWGRGANNLAVAELALSGQRVVIYGTAVAGIGGGILMSALAYHTGNEIAAALNNDDPVRARALLIDFGAKTAGGWIAGSYSASLAATVLSPLIVGGPVGGAAFVLLTGTAALVGGYWGVEAVDKILNTFGLNPSGAQTDTDFFRVRQFGNGVIYREFDSNAAQQATGVVTIVGYEKSWWIPNQGGGYTSISMDTSSGSSLHRVWSGEPGRSTLLSSVETQRESDGVIQVIKQVNGSVTGRSRIEIGINNLPAQQTDSTITGTNTQTIDSYAFVNGAKSLRSSTVVDSLEDANGTSRIETVTTYTNGVPSTVRNVYDNDGTLHSTTPLAPSAAFNLTNQSAAEALNALNAFLGAVRSGQPVPLLTSGFNLVYSLGGHPPNLQGANTVISGLGSLYGLHTAFQGGGSGVPLNTTDSIAAYAIFYWATGLNESQSTTANDADWRISA